MQYFMEVKNLFIKIPIKMIYSKLGISNNKIIYQLPIQGRESYMEYHREEIFQGNISN